MADQPQPKSSDLMLAFTANHDPAAARRRFVERFGCQPQYAVYAYRLLLLGPVKPEVSK